MPNFTFKSTDTNHKCEPTKKGSWWLTGFKLNRNNNNKKQGLAAISTQGLFPASCTSERNLHWTVCLCNELPACTVSAIWANPYKRVPGILFLRIGLRLSPSNQSFTASANQSSSIVTNHNSTIWTNQTVRIWSPQVHEDKPIRDQRWGKPAPLRLSLSITFCFHQRLETGSPWLSWNY